MSCPFYIGHIEQFFGSHDQYKYTYGSHMTNIEHLESRDEYHTLPESHNRAHDKHGYRTLPRMYQDDNFGSFH